MPCRLASWQKQRRSVLLPWHPVARHLVRESRLLPGGGHHRQGHRGCQTAGESCWYSLIVKSMEGKTVKSGLQAKRRGEGAFNLKMSFLEPSCPVLRHNNTLLPCFLTAVVNAARVVKATVWTNCQPHLLFVVAHARKREYQIMTLDFWRTGRSRFSWNCGEYT